MSNDFESVTGSIDESLAFTQSPKADRGYFICMCKEDYKPNHTLNFASGNTQYWCMKCGLGLGLRQIDEYSGSPAYIENDKTAKAGYRQKHNMFYKKDDDDHMHIERKDGVNVVSYKD